MRFLLLIAFVLIPVSSFCGEKKCKKKDIPVTAAVKKKNKADNDYFLYDYGFWWTDPMCRKQKEKKKVRVLLTKK